MSAQESHHQPATHENPYLALSPKDRVVAFKSNLISIMETPQPTEKQKTAFVNNLIAVQHTMAENSSKLSAEDAKESRVFADFFSNQAKILVEKNIVLPVKNEVIKPENQNFPAYLLSLNGILAELAHLEQIEQKPDAKKAQLYTDVLNSFQRFLCSEYNNNNSEEMKAVVDLGISIYVEIVNKLTALGHKLLSNNEKTTTAIAQKEKETSPNIQIKIDLTGVEKSIDKLVTSIKEKMPKLTMDLGKWILSGIKRFTEKKSTEQKPAEKPVQSTVWKESNSATSNPFTQEKKQNIAPPEKNQPNKNQLNRHKKKK